MYIVLDVKQVTYIFVAPKGIKDINFSFDISDSGFIIKVP